MQHPELLQKAVKYDCKTATYYIKQINILGNREILYKTMTYGTKTHKIHINTHKHVFIYL